MRRSLTSTASIESYQPPWKLVEETLMDGYTLLERRSLLTSRIQRYQRLSALRRAANVDQREMDDGESTEENGGS